MKNMKRTMVLLVAFALLMGCAIGGTLAWLMDATETVTNTFTTSNIEVTLTEEKPENETAKMVPGLVIEKDPKVTVTSGSEPCWLFVKVEKNTNVDTFLTWSVDTTIWETIVETGDNYTVYAKRITSSDMGNAYSILTDDKVTVKSSITKDDMVTITTENQPKLTFTAYASQLMNNKTEFSAKEAWHNVSDPEDATPFTEK